jgi:hypothetical protein
MSQKAWTLEEWLEKRLKRGKSSRVPHVEKLLKELAPYGVLTFNRKEKKLELSKAFVQIHPKDTYHVQRIQRLEAIGA